MAYEKTNWIDRIVDETGTVIQEGTPINAFNMNKIEDGIEQCSTEMPEYRVAEVQSSSYAKSYKLQVKRGESEWVDVEGQINIPKDMVVEDGDVKECTEPDVPIEGLLPGDKYVDLVISNSDNKHIYIDARDLVDNKASGIGYDNSESGLDASNVQEAIDEIAANSGPGYEIIETESDSHIVTAPEGTHFAGVLKYEGKNVYYPDRTQTVNFFDPSLVNTSIFTQTSSGNFHCAGTNAYVKFCDVNDSYLGELTNVRFTINQGSQRAMSAQYIFTDGTSVSEGLYSYNVHEYNYNIPSGKTLKSIEIYTTNGADIYNIKFSAKVTGICAPTIVTGLRKGINESILIVPDQIKSLPDYGFSGNIVDLDNCKYYHNNMISVDLHNTIPLEIPEIIDIKPLGSPFKISAGETIEFSNSDNVDIPNTVAYKIERRHE